MITKLPPGPKSQMLGLDLAQKFRNDPLGLATGLHREFGDIVYIKLGPIDYYMMHHPDHVSQILVSRPKDFVKSEQFKRIIRSVDGNGLVASEGEFWQKQRRTINPTFDAEHIARYKDVIVDCTLRHIEDWQPGSVIEIHHEMTMITLKIAARIFLGVDVTGQEEELASAVDAISQVMYREFTDFIPLPEWLPTPSKLEKRHAVEVLERMIKQGIAEQRANPVPTSMLGMLIPLMPEEQVIAEAKTMFNAGHDSTAAALAWSFYLLLRNPAIYQKVVDDATADGAEYIGRFAKEALRLYPPAWVIPRQVAHDTQFEDYELPKGAVVNVFPWIIQRDERFFPNPEVCDPDRFSPENEHSRPHFAWFPFGAGGRACIGRDLALKEMELIIALICRKFHLQFAPDQNPDVEPNPLISLEPKGGVKVRIDVR